MFKEYDCEILPASDTKPFPTLVVRNRKDSRKQLTISPFTDTVKAGRKGGEDIRLSSVVIYVDKNNTFYLPESLTGYFK
ncbi:hypothetical protein Barb4_03622 [Bacteroidales bacterium Barb4]|nr:hypothetical protein Barb4_03622 [Bacteroidales bacterium Barb4]